MSLVVSRMSFFLSKVNIYFTVSKHIVNFRKYFIYVFISFSLSFCYGKFQTYRKCERLEKRTLVYPFTDATTHLSYTLFKNCISIHQSIPRGTVISQALPWLGCYFTPPSISPQYLVLMLIVYIFECASCITSYTHRDYVSQAEARGRAWLLGVVWWGSQVEGGGWLLSPPIPTGLCSSWPFTDGVQSIPDHQADADILQCRHGPGPRTDSPLGPHHDWGEQGWVRVSREVWRTWGSDHRGRWGSRYAHTGIRYLLMSLLQGMLWWLSFSRWVKRPKKGKVTCPG